MAPPTFETQSRCKHSIIYTVNKIMAMLQQLLNAHIAPAMIVITMQPLVNAHKVETNITRSRYSSCAWYTNTCCIFLVCAAWRQQSFECSLGKGDRNFGTMSNERACAYFFSSESQITVECLANVSLSQRSLTMFYRHKLLLNITKCRK